MPKQDQQRRVERYNMSARLAVIPQDVECRRVFRASYSLVVGLSLAQRRALVETSLDRNVPAGRVLARKLSEPDRRGRDIEVISGWHFLEAYWEENDRSVRVSVSLIEADDADALHYAIENAYEEARFSGYEVSVIDYAEAVVRARERFANSLPNMTRMAAALRIGRPTLVNRVRLLERLAPRVIELVRGGQLTESAAKTLAAVKDEREQARYADTLVNNPMSKRAFYALVNPDYQPRAGVLTPVSAVVIPKGPDEVSLLSRIESRFGTPADLVTDGGEGEGSEVRLRFHSAEELLGLAQRLAMADDPGRRIRGEVALQSASHRELDELLLAMRVTEDDY